MTGKQTQILVVEDDAIISLALQETLQRLGYAIAATASRGQDAIAKAAQTQPDLVLMDIRLGDSMDGVEAAKEIRARADIPIVYLTAYTDRDTLDRAKATQPYGYIVKPYSAQELHSAVEIALYKHQIEREMHDELEQHVQERTAELAQANQRLRQEIDERVRVEEALWASTSRMHTLFESITDGIVVMDLQGVITDVNEATVRQQGCESKEDLIGQKAFEFIAEDDRERTVAYLRAALESERMESIEYQAQTRDGRLFDVDVSAALLRDGRGNPSGMVAIARDITARKQAEQELETYRQHLEELVYARTRRLLGLNEALEREIAERKQVVEELVALNRISQTLASSPNLDQVLDTIVREVAVALKTEAGSASLLLLDEGSDELVFHAAAGRLADQVKGQRLPAKLGIAGWVVQESKPVIVPDVRADDRFYTGVDEATGFTTRSLVAVPLEIRDKVAGVIEVVNKIEGGFTEHDLEMLSAIAHLIAIAIENTRLMEEAAEAQVLRELDRLRSELVSNVSHELRTPLGLIKVFSTTLLSDEVQFDRETEQECLRNIADEADKLEQIVDNLLDLSQIQGQYLRLDRRPTDVGQLAREVARRMEVHFTRHSLVFDLPDRPLTATVDRRRMEQVLRNLLGNAVKYSPHGGTITVRGFQDRHQVLVGVSDEGIGIPQEHLENVFERFFRVDNQVTREVSGAGLGLAVCQGIVRAHGGRIWAESTLGVGTTIYFGLPIDLPGAE